VVDEVEVDVLELVLVVEVVEVDEEVEVLVLVVEDEVVTVVVVEELVVVDVEVVAVVVVLDEVVVELDVVAVVVLVLVEVEELEVVVDELEVAVVVVEELVVAVVVVVEVEVEDEVVVASGSPVGLVGVIVSKKTSLVPASASVTPSISGQVPLVSTQPLWTPQLGPPSSQTLYLNCPFPPSKPPLNSISITYQVARETSCIV